MSCPKCGGRMRTCCERFREYVRENKIPFEKALHACGIPEYTCDDCGYEGVYSFNISKSWKEQETIQDNTYACGFCRRRPSKPINIWKLEFPEDVEFVYPCSKCILPKILEERIDNFYRRFSYPLTKTPDLDKHV